MATPEGTNLQRLQDAGLIMQELPEPYKAVVEGLTDDEVEILVSIQTRLGHADQIHGVEPAPPGQPPAFTSYVIF